MKAKQSTSSRSGSGNGSGGSVLENVLRAPKNAGRAMCVGAVGVVLLALSFAAPLLLAHQQQLAGSILRAAQAPAAAPACLPMTIEEIRPFFQLQAHRAALSIVSVLPSPPLSAMKREMAANALHLALQQLEDPMLNATVADDLVYLAVHVAEFGGINNDKDFKAISTRVSDSLKRPQSDAKKIFHTLSTARTLSLIDLIDTDKWQGLIAELAAPEGGFKPTKDAEHATMEATYQCMKSMMVLGTWVTYTKTAGVADRLTNFVLSMANPLGGFGEVPAPVNETVREVTLHATLHAVLILREFLPNENATKTFARIPYFLKFTQGADGGFHAAPIQHVALAKPSNAATTAQAIYLMHLLEAQGVAVAAFLPRATAYLASCVSPVDGTVLASAPWGAPDVLAAYNVLRAAADFPAAAEFASTEAVLPPTLSKLAFAAALIAFAAAAVCWFREQIDADSYKQMVRRGRMIFFLCLFCYIVILVRGQLAITAYVALGAYLSMLVYEAQDNSTEPELIVAVASVQCLAFVSLPLAFQMALPTVFYQSIIGHVLVLWNVLVTAVVTFASGYFLPPVVKRANMAFFTRASLISWVINITAAAFVIFSGDMMNMYRLAVLRGDSVALLVVLPVVSYFVTQGVAAVARRMYIEQGTVKTGKKTN
eukprot:TRINITY_DN2199_c1_g1_i1.p1 TRINITY_DN2199_c1_g1~~TRINITY_DN2199_c1_g1_i1.p1  ORF type:complete len:655 (-),score=191.68 TRINITY_DN2199_c1_g1_i1:470-2434(-)